MADPKDNPRKDTDHDDDAAEKARREVRDRNAPRPPGTGPQPGQPSRSESER